MKTEKIDIFDYIFQTPKGEVLQIKAVMIGNECDEILQICYDIFSSKNSDKVIESANFNFREIESDNVDHALQFICNRFNIEVFELIENAYVLKKIKSNKGGWMSGITGKSGRKKIDPKKKKQKSSFQFTKEDLEKMDEIRKKNSEYNSRAAVLRAAFHFFVEYSGKI